MEPLRLLRSKRNCAQREDGDRLKYAPSHHRVGVGKVVAHTARRRGLMPRALSDGLRAVTRSGLPAAPSCGPEVRAISTPAKESWSSGDRLFEGHRYNEGDRGGPSEPLSRRGVPSRPA